MQSAMKIKVGWISFTSQAEPLVVDLKDLFHVIFNMRKKEAEASQKVTVPRGV